MAKKLNKKNLMAIQKWMDSKSGQMLLQYAYSWGAAIVILGALFKLTHIAGADIMLFIGMGTEVIVFFLSGFERPWDKESDIVTDDLNPELPARADDEEDYTDEERRAAAQGPVIIGGGGVIGGGVIGGNVIGGGVVGGTGGGGTVIIGGGGVVGGGNVVAGGNVNAVEGEPVDPAELAGRISATAPIIGGALPTGMTPEMEEATKAYVEQLNELTETLKLVAEQSARLTRDSEEMETMNRTLTGINRFYEMQLRNLGAQSGTLDEVHEQTKRLAEQLDELNGIYTKMVEALKTNLR